VPAAPRRRPALVVAAALLAGCGGMRGEEDCGSRPAGPPEPGRARLYVHTTGPICFSGDTVEIDGRVRGASRCGAAFAVDLPPGEHGVRIPGMPGPRPVGLQAGERMALERGSVLVGWRTVYDEQCYGYGRRGRARCWLVPREEPVYVTVLEVASPERTAAIAAAPAVTAANAACRVE
jgi:hypothetical protein